MLSSAKVSMKMSHENLDNYTKYVENLLAKNLPVLIFAGEFDEKDGPATIEPWLKTL